MTTVASPPDAPIPQRVPRRRARYVFAVGGCVVAIVAIVLLAVELSGNVVYFRTVTEAVHDRKNLGTDRFRLAGAVVPDTIHTTARGVRFEVTDGRTTVSVDHTGDPPDLFKPKAPVVVEGHWQSTQADAVFESDRILIKHGSDYEPPKVDTNKASTS
ncbi:MAG TPA: cytochrome c maturation protein CcmE [Acidimicrobiia bacterium]|nr:cytochrome c maturation protein CcmE [Acidimicrobiia bacterium]